MEEKRTSVFENGLIWFGAAVSIAEILTGTYCTSRLYQRLTCYLTWSYYWMHYAVLCRTDRR